MALMTKDEVKQLSALVLAVILATVTVNLGRWGNPMTGPGEDIEKLTDSLFGANVLAFEVLGIVLLVALVGSLVLAMRGGDDA